MIRLLILDVDGCMTEGKIIYSNDGVELKNFNVKDGFAIKEWMKMGHHAAIITGRNSPIVAHRAKELGIVHVHQGVKDKQAVGEMVCRELGVTAEETAAIGDDLNDYRLLRWVGSPYTPADGSDYIKSFAQVLERRGGDACVREMIEKIFKNNGEEETFLSRWI